MSARTSQLLVMTPDPCVSADVLMWRGQSHDRARLARRMVSRWFDVHRQEEAEEALVVGSFSCGAWVDGTV